jgi:hypothetical protein
LVRDEVDAPRLVGSRCLEPFFPMLYRKIRALLNREGWNVGKYLICRLYKEEGMTLKKMRPQRKRKAFLNERNLPVPVAYSCLSDFADSHPQLSYRLE